FIMPHTRRTFLKAGSAVAAVSFTRAQMAQAGVMPGSGGVSAALNQFDYGDVELLEGPMRQQFDANHALFLSLEA
ncbi:MAG: hypothetical protein WAK26_05200, partial [Terracidiphilus sp.]